MKLKVYRDGVPNHIQVPVNTDAGQVAADICDDDGNVISSGVFDDNAFPPQYEIEDVKLVPKKAPAKKKPAAKKAPAKKPAAKK